MAWLGKLVGGTIGFALGGPLGAIAGATFGHMFDQTESPHRQEKIISLTPQETAQYTFFLAVFSMLAKLTQADGQVSSKERDTIERFMTQDLNLNPFSRQQAMRIFHSAAQAPETFEDFARQFYAQFHMHPRMLEFMIDILIRVSVADGQQSPNEEVMIRKAVMIFHFGDEAYRRLKSRYIRDTERYYQVLGCSSNDSDEHIKRQYRQRVMEYHPDRMVAKGLPEDFAEFAQKRFREIQEAYEAIKKERGIK